jgi:hypothetical protein
VDTSEFEAQIKTLVDSAESVIDNMLEKINQRGSVRKVFDWGRGQSLTVPADYKKIWRVHLLSLSTTEKKRGVSSPAQASPSISSRLPRQQDESALGSSSVQTQNASLNPGGIDFRSLPIVTQAIGNLSANINLHAITRLSALELNQELQNIQRMISSEFTPSVERIKEYIQVSCLKEDSVQDLDKVILCISDILRQEEESLHSTEPVLKDILVLLESGISPAELKAIFTGLRS